MNEKQQELYEKLLKKVNEYCLGQAAEDVIAAIDDLAESYECTGQTPSEALNAIKEQMPKYDEVGTVEVSKADIRSIEKSLKALEILERYVFEIEKYDTEYWIFFDGMEGENDDLSKEEYELLKEVLK